MSRKSDSGRARTCVLLLALLAGATLAACGKQTGGISGNATASPTAVNDANVAQKVAEARTPAEHNAIASYYESRAEEAQREFGEDRELQQRYEQRMQHDNHPMSAGARDHLRSLGEGHEAGARHYHAMAEWHREMARSAEQSSTATE